MEGATISAIVLAMNRGMDHWVSISFTYPPSLHLKAKFVKKNWLRTIILMWCKQVPITYVSLGLLQWNEGFQTPLEQANKTISRFLLSCCSFNKKATFKFFSTICKYAPNVFNALYCKFRLVRFSHDPVTYVTKHSLQSRLFVLKHKISEKEAKSEFQRL